MKGPLVQEESATNDVEVEDEVVLVEKIELGFDVVLVVLALLVKVLVEEVEVVFLVEEDVDDFLTTRASRIPPSTATGPLSTITTASIARVKAKKAARQYLYSNMTYMQHKHEKNKKVAILKFKCQKI